jgi:hypothetical protein
MLSKLMKYELKATSRILIPLYLVLLVISLVNRIIYTPNRNVESFRIIDQFLLSIHATFIGVVLIVTVIYMIIRFYKNLLTDEGYLMFTLPVKVNQLITSKLLITMLWLLISVIVVMSSLFITFANPEFLSNAMKAISMAIQDLNREFGGKWIMVFTQIIIMALLGIISHILLVYVSIALGQLWSKHRIIGSFVSYMVIYTAIQFILIILFIPFGVFVSDNQTSASTLSTVIFPMIIVVITLECVASFFVTNYIFKRRLNLE